MGDQITEPESAEEQTPQEEEQEETTVAEEEETGMTPGLKELYKENNLKENGDPVEEDEQEHEGEEEGAEEQELSTEDDGGKYSKRVQTRINKATKSLREEERKNKALETKVAELEAKATQGPPAEPPAPAQPPEPDQSEVKVAELRTKVAGLKKESRAARRDFDDDKADTLDDQIDEIKEQIYAEKYKQPAVDPEKVTKMVQEQQLKASDEAAAKDFSVKNAWFRQLDDDGTPNTAYDNVKSHRAVALARELGATWKGTPHELYTTIANTVNKEHPPAQPRRKMSAVGVVNQNTATNNTETVALDEVQREIAHGAFPEMSKGNAEKEYAKINKQYGKRSA